MYRVWKEVFVIGTITVLSSAVMIALVGDISFDKDGKEILHWVGPLHSKERI